MKIFKAGLLCFYCLKGKKEELRRNYRIGCLDALSEARDEALAKYDFEIIDSVELNDALSFMDNLALICFYCEGSGEIYKMVEKVNNINAVAVKKEKGNVLYIDFSTKKKAEL